MISRILVLSTNREISPQPTLPIGAAWVAEALDRAGFTVHFLDLCFEKNPLQRLQQILSVFNPEGIAISIRNLDNCDFLSPISYLPQVQQITDFIKQRSPARMLVGGSAVSIMPRQLLDYLDLPYAMVGAGEGGAPLFFAAPDPTHAAIPGLVHRNLPAAGDAFGSQENGALAPRLERWVDTRNYLRLEPVLPVQGKRGCVNRCLYCTYPAIEGGSWRLREPGAVVEEMLRSQKATGAREFEFVDSVFNEPAGYLEALFEEVLRQGLRANFRISSLSPKGLTTEQVRLMERAGVTSAVVTPESACDLTLAALGKSFTEREVRQAAETLAGSRIRALWCFLLGGPDEDRATLGGTVHFINDSMAQKDGAFITTGIRVYPGTGLRERAIRDGAVQAADPLLMPRFYFSPKLTPLEAREILRQGLSRGARCIFPSETGHRSVAPLRRLGTLLRLPGPFWRYAGYLNRFTKGRRALDRTW
jgi:anaerobic magnesium-protoporphyrin IX monomethyl ester cyclase